MVAEKSARRVPAFTLIELLVVVAIIALLLSILLPSLAKARESAKASVCLSRLKNLGAAQQSYSTEYEGYLPGSPLTTGFPLAVYSTTTKGAWKAGMPMNIYDYTVPLLKQMGQRLPSGDDNRNAYWQHTTSGPMLCPSNNQVAPPYPTPSDPKLKTVVIPAISYLTMNTIVRGGPGAYNHWSQGANKTKLMKETLDGVTDSVGPEDMGQSASWQMKLPHAYVPRMEAVGRASLKVYLADGLRFYDKNTNTLDFNRMKVGFGGYHSAQPPCDISTNKGVPAREYVQARKYSYRHTGGEVINALMLDGHAEPLRAAFRTDAKGNVTGGAGTALHPKHYFPSNTDVLDNSYLFLKAQVARGTKLP